MYSDVECGTTHGQCKPEGQTPHMLRNGASKAEDCGRSPLLHSHPESRGIRRYQCQETPPPVAAHTGARPFLVPGNAQGIGCGRSNDRGSPEVARKGTASRCASHRLPFSMVAPRLRGGGGRVGANILSHQQFCTLPKCRCLATINFSSPNEPPTWQNALQAHERLPQDLLLR